MSDFLTARRTRVAANLPLDDALLIVGAGRPVALPEISDQTYPFRSHAEYFYLTELECTDGIIAYDPRNSEWASFVPAVTQSERVWEGSSQLEG
ncbi:MAG: aminopeptidase P N-terminal domain-containing protein, partial [Opitutaceae bacterium]